MVQIPIINYLLSFGVPLVLAMVLIPRFSAIAMKVGLVDHPGDRKVHSSAKPLVGGLVMMISISISCLLFVPLQGLRGLYAGIFLLTLVGIFDDFHDISYRTRFAAQVVAVLLLYYLGDGRLTTFGDLLWLGQITFKPISLLATLFCIVGVINALNMIDGLDGLAGGISLVAFSSYAVLAHLNGQVALLMVALAMMGALLAFLYYNKPPSRLFMGDAGSVAIGFMLGYFSIAVTHYEVSIVPPVCALLILTVPITDTMIVMFVRKKKGNSPFKADRGHLHHILIRFGYSKAAAVIILVGLSFVFSSLSVAGAYWGIPEPLMFMAFVAYFLLSACIAYNIKFLYRMRLSGKLFLPFAQELSKDNF